jgi:predicted permease
MQFGDLLATIGPLFGLILCGFLAGKSKLVAPSSARALSGYVYYFALPALLFETTARSSLQNLTNWGFVLANLGGILASFLLAFFLARFFFRLPLLVAAIDGMAASYGNTGYMGVPLISVTLSQGAVLPATLAVLIHNVPVVMTVTLLAEFALPTEDSSRPTHLFKNVVRAVFGNPLNLAVLCGLGFALAHVALPSSLDNFARLLANAAGPTGLFVLGLGMVPSPTPEKPLPYDRAGVILLAFLKIGLQPLVSFFFAFVIFHVAPLWAMVTVLMAAMPIGANVAIFAQNYDIHVSQVNVAILISTLLSLIMLPVLVLFLQS